MIRGAVLVWVGNDDSGPKTILDDEDLECGLAKMITFKLEVRSLWLTRAHLKLLPLKANPVKNLHRVKAIWETLRFFR